MACIMACIMYCGTTQDTRTPGEWRAPTLEGSPQIYIGDVTARGCSLALFERKNYNMGCAPSAGKLPLRCGPYSRRGENGGNLADTERCREARRPPPKEPR